MATWSGDVTSYTKFSTANELMSFQSGRCLVVPSLLATSAGSPEVGGVGAGRGKVSEERGGERKAIQCTECA